MSVLVIAEHNNHLLHAATLHTVQAAQQCGSDVHVLVAGHDCSAVCQQVSRIAGISKVLAADDVRFAHALAEELAALVVALATDYEHVLFAATANGKNCAPRVAALLDVAQVSDVVKIVSPDTFERPVYAGNAIATVRSRDKIRVLTVRATAFEPVSADAGNAPISGIEIPALPPGVTFVGSQLNKSERPELTSARIVVSGGRALGSAEKFTELLAPLADKLGAALGASRAAVDAGYVSNDLQVGQTGKIVAPQLYVACGISGAIQHLAGMKDSKVIVAINKDPEAPIFSIADYGLEADLFEAIPELVRSL